MVIGHSGHSLAETLPLRAGATRARPRGLTLAATLAGHALLLGLVLLLTAGEWGTQGVAGLALITAATLTVAVTASIYTDPRSKT